MLWRYCVPFATPPTRTQRAGFSKMCVKFGPYDPNEYGNQLLTLYEKAFRFYDIIASLSLGTSLSFGDPTQPGTSFVEPDANRLRPLETIFGRAGARGPGRRGRAE